MSWDEEPTKVPTEEEAGASSGQDRVSVVLHHQDRIQIVPLEEGVAMVVGRSRVADVQILDSSLSRRHARFEIAGDGVTVEDLQSTNGTEVNGQKITRRVKIGTADRVLIGSVAASIHILSPNQSKVPGAETHEEFVSHLESAVKVARNEDGTLGLMMVRAVARDANGGEWVQQVREMLHSSELLAMYGPDVAEVLLPGANSERARVVAEALTREKRGRPPGLVCGVAMFPSSAGSGEDLHEAVRRAAQNATPDYPVQWAPARDAGAWTSNESGGWTSLVAPTTMDMMRSTVSKLARTNIPVLICGETGAGKEVIARAIHEESNRHSKPMLCINCGAIPDTLIESELFGHERGAFTGADRRAKGVFEEADGGTVLLDEIGELSPSAQAALLRVLETKRISRVGSKRSINVDVRILAATHRDLEAMCDEETFRWDLLYRLNTMTLRLPPLRERRAEIEPLALHFLKQANEANDTRVVGIAPEAMMLLRQYAWPGNVRELRNVIDRAVVIAGHGMIEVAHMSERILAGATMAGSISAFSTDEVTSVVRNPIIRSAAAMAPVSFKARVRRLEAALIGEALRVSGWNKAEAARQLRIPLRTLKEKVRADQILEGTHNPEEAQLLIDAYLRTVSPDVRADTEADFKDRIQQYEAALISDALSSCGFNKAEAARKLRIPIRTLTDKIRAYELAE